MKRVKKRIFSGAVCEQMVFAVSDRVKDVKSAEPPKPRFKTEKERAQHRNSISKRLHAQLFNENFSPAAQYSTLTFDQENEIHTFEEARQIRKNFVRVLKRINPAAVIFAYIGRGKATHRIHLHMVSTGVPENVITEKWKYGSVVRISNLRSHNFYNGVDHGQDYTGLANYLWEHWTPEQGGHRWFMTKNARKPEKEPTEEIKRDYSEKKPPRPPKGYMLVEARQTPYGYLYFKYVRIPPQPPRNRRGQSPPRS